MEWMGADGTDDMKRTFCRREPAGRRMPENTALDARSILVTRVGVMAAVGRLASSEMPLIENAFHPK
jgi:hypothetical protein